MKKIVYVDMDGVVADFDSEMQKLLPDVHLGEGDPSTYAERSKAVDKAMQENPRLFKNLLPIPNAQFGIYHLRNSELYDIYFLSTPVCLVPESYMDKRIWLRENFGEWADKRLILTHRKDLCIGDYLIDDRFKNGTELFQGKHIHFGGEGFPDWISVIKYLIHDKREGIRDSSGDGQEVDGLTSLQGS